MPRAKTQPSTTERSRVVTGKKKRKSTVRPENRKPTEAKRDSGTSTNRIFEAITTPSPHGAAGNVRQRRPEDVAGLSKNQLVEIYSSLFETRRLEEHLVALYRQNKVIGGVYRSLGQEGTAVGCAYALRDGDYIQPLIRDLGAMLVHGATPLAMLRQYMARATGPSGGRDLNQHFSDPRVGFLGPVSMLGAMVPVLVGCLFAARRKGEAKVGIAFNGDGGSSTGSFYEGMNFATILRLPLIAVIEANRYAYSTPTAAQVPDGDLLRRARGFGAMVIHVDGNDVLACYEAARDARERGLATKGPTLIVADTYRRKGHAEHDNQKYVEPGELEDWRQANDPIDRYVRFLTEGEHASTDDLERVRQTVEHQLDAAREQAVSEDFPDPANLTAGVFADDTNPWPSTDTWFRGGPPHRQDP